LIERAVGVFGAEEGEFGVVLFSVADTVFKDGPVASDVAGCAFDDCADVFGR